MAETNKQDELELAGWTRQATYDEPRLGEMIETYQELGFEVRTEPFEPAGRTECDTCMAQNPERYKTIYTRKKTST